MSSTVDPTIQPTGVLVAEPARPRKHCSLAKTLELLSTRSAFLVLREVFYGHHRFDEIRTRAGISEPVAAARLRELVDAELLERSDYREPGERTRQEYRLTEKGADLLPALFALMKWGDRWVQGERGGPVTFRHRECGAEVKLEMRCEKDHSVDRGQLDLFLSESWSRGRSGKRLNKPSSR